ncbi:MAG: hypothetical protein IJ409_01620 [Lachnospiraceae bacterium]|nr:hypothetical protein [Lachnospiraceae bacterium]
MKKNDEYLSRGMDLKRLVMYFQKKIWIILLLAAIGAAIGGISYQIMRSVRMPVEYATVSKLYIRFGYDETGEVYQYYNGYTWNDLLDTDPIMDLVMKSLPGYEREEVQAATTAEILSDIRLLTITVSGGNEKFVREIRDAVEDGLMEYAKESEELQQIKVIRSDAPERVYWDNRTTAACITGAVILGLIAFFLFAFRYALDDAVYIQADVEKKYGQKALGIMAESQKGLQPYTRELKANIHYLLAEHKQFAILDMANHAEMRQMELDRMLNWEEAGTLGGDERIENELVWHVREEDEDEEPVKGEWEIIPFDESNMSEEQCKEIREIGGVVILLPFGADASRKTQRMLGLLRNQDCKVLGMIIAQADEEFLNRYYA